MIVVGLTGSIGMGKTTVAGLCRELGLKVNSADEIVHRLLAPEGAAFASVAHAFPEAVKGGAIDRIALGAIVFADAQRLAALEAILHPLVAAEREVFLATCRAANEALVVLDIPLLFEKNLESIADIVITVSAPEEIQKARVMARPGMTAEKYQSILAAQLPDAEKRRRSQYVLDTGGTPETTLILLHEILEDIDINHAPNRSRH